MNYDDAKTTDTSLQFLDEEGYEPCSEDTCYEPATTEWRHKPVCAPCRVECQKRADEEAELMADVHAAAEDWEGALADEDDDARDDWDGSDAVDEDDLAAEEED